MAGYGTATLDSPLDMGTARTQSSRWLSASTSAFGRRFWNSYARTYDSLAEWFPPYQSMLSDVTSSVVQGLDHAVILDAGCGTGNYSWELARRGHDVTGLDVSDAMLARARCKTCSARVQPCFLHHDLSQPLPFPSETFSAVLAVMVIYAVPEPSALLRELRRVSVRGARAVFVTSASKSVLVPSVQFVLRELTPTRALRTLTALASVGIHNAVIDALHAARSWHVTSDNEFERLLIRAGWNIVDISRTYVGDSAIKATVSAR